MSTEVFKTEVTEDQSVQHNSPRPRPWVTLNDLGI